MTPAVTARSLGNQGRKEDSREQAEMPRPLHTVFVNNTLSCPSNERPVFLTWVKYKGLVWLRRISQPQPNLEHYIPHQGKAHGELLN